MAHCIANNILTKYVAFLVMISYPLINSYCTVSARKHLPNNGKAILVNNFYDSQGKMYFMDTLTIWYKDSLVIEQQNQMNTITDIAGVTSINFSILLYRYIDLKQKTLYDYKNFSDTAKIIHQAILPDTGMRDHGWNFYLENEIQIEGMPEKLNDTIIGNNLYKRIKYNKAGQNPKKIFTIGYLQCDKGENMFSLEKIYCKSINCMMVKFFDFIPGRTTPFATGELFFLSDSLSQSELKVFDAWQQNATKNPVTR